MGVRISSWNLAREVSKMGELGVISGTAMDVIFVRELQDGKHYLRRSYNPMCVILRIDICISDYAFSTIHRRSWWTLS